MSNEQVNTAKIGLFTQEIYFDALLYMENDFNLYDDGSDIMVFGQQTFSSNDPTVSNVEPL